jgi:hypothetical protein
MNILGLQEESEISCHHEPSIQVISHPKYCSTAAVLLSWFGISNCFGGCKEEEDWKTSHMVDPHKLFSGVLTDLREIINYNFDGEDHILTIFNYMDAIRCQLWEIAFSLSWVEITALTTTPPRKTTFFFKLTTGSFTCTFQITWISKIMISYLPLVFCQGSLYSLI